MKKKKYTLEITHDNGKVTTEHFDTVEERNNRVQDLQERAKNAMLALEYLNWITQ